MREKIVPIEVTPEMMKMLEICKRIKSINLSYIPNMTLKGVEETLTVKVCSCRTYRNRRNSCL